MDEKVRKKRSKFDRSKDIMDMGVMGVYDEKDLGHSVEMEPNREKKKKHKYKKNKCETNKVFNLNEVVEENCTGIAAKGQTCSNEGNVTFMRNGEDENNKSKRKKRKKGRDNNEIINSIIVGDKEMQFLDDKQERKTKKRKKCDDSISGAEEVAASKSSNKSKGTENNKFKSNEGGSSLVQVEMGDANRHSVVTDNDDQGKKMKKKKLSNKSKRTEDSEFPSNVGNSSQAENNEGHPQLVNMTMGDANEHGIATEVDNQGKKRKKKKRKKRNKEDKRVTFSDQVEILNDGLIRGKRFTPEEDEKIKEAVYRYIESHGLGDQGLDMVLHCGSHREIRRCWREIALALPQRPYLSIYSRAHVLFERDDSHKWTPEEYEFIRKFVENHGYKWQMLATAMGKHRFHVKDAWRRIKLRNTNKGRWTQEEYQTLFDLVNTDLRLRALEDHKKLKYGMLRDNICWEAIGEKLATRTSQFCCKKWYDQLTSPMVAEGEWTDTDDYRLLKALYTLDACSMEEVDWDNLVEQRSGEVCRKRWNQMVRHIREHGNKSFAEQVEILSKRYCPDLLEAREAFDNKPVVP